MKDQFHTDIPAFCVLQLHSCRTKVRQMELFKSQKCYCSPSLELWLTRDVMSLIHNFKVFPSYIICPKNFDFADFHDLGHDRKKNKKSMKMTQFCHDPLPPPKCEISHFLFE